MNGKLHTPDLSLPDLEIEEVFEPDEGDSSVAESLFDIFRRRVSRFFEEGTERLFSNANDGLFAQARDAPNDDYQRDCFDAMQELHRVKSAVRTGFLKNILDALEELWSTEVGQEPWNEAAGMDFGEMSLVDTRSMDDQVQVAKIATRASPGLRAGEHALEHRLSQLLPSPVDGDANPVSVSNVCMSFHSALQNLGAERITRLALFQALEATVVANLGTLHQELNDLLIAEGIAPKIPLGRPRQVGKHAEETPNARPQEQSVDAAAVPTPAVAGQPAAGQSGPPEGVAVSQQAIPPGPVTGATLEIPFADACASAQRLMGLARALSSTGRIEPVGTPEETAKPEDRAAVEAALARIQQSGKGESWGAKGPYAFAARVRAALAEQGIKLTDPATRDALEVVSKLLDNILADPLVQASAKQYIRRLGLPLGRAALTDGTFFASDSHPARQTINCLGRLVVSGGQNDGEVPVPAASVDAVVTELLRAPGADRTAFAGAANAIDRLLERQNAHFEREVAGLLEKWDHQQSMLDERRGDNEDREPALSAAEAAHNDWQRALESASSLAMGDVAILTTEPSLQKPATFVWKSRDNGLLVFADALGRRAASFGRREFAMALLRGSVHLDEAARMPIVDRAMCSVLQDLHGKLEHKANRDALTGLANHKRLESELARAMKSSTTGARRHHVCCLGLAYLPEIAARFEQQAADTLITRYAPLLERQIGDRGLVAHLGQGRFAILLEDSSRTEVLQLMERHRRSIELSECAYKGEPIQLAVGIGIVAVAPGANDPAEVLEAANTAHQTASAGSPMGLHVQETLAGRGPGVGVEDTAPDISQLIAEDRLALRCQRVAPIDPQATLSPYYEVLLGVRDEKGSIGPPGEIILAAERAGQISQLDRWVVARVLRWLGAHDAEVSSLKGLAINLSGGTLSDPKLARFVAEELESSGVRADRIMFEVTESAAIDRLSVAREFIETLQGMGCRFALDDFGAGHASFSYLKLLPVDTVKIDGMFVKDIVSNPADEAMVRSINEVAKLLGKCTVAEFVEDDATLERLRELGVDYAQGYGIERPIPIDDLITTPAFPGEVFPRAQKTA